MTTKTTAVTVDEAVTAIRKREGCQMVGFIQTASNPVSHDTNIQNIEEKPKDIEIVLKNFRYNVGTSLDCAMATGILRNSITYYISCLIELGLLGIVRKEKDRTTRHWAFHYSADSSLWPKRRWVQLKLWEG